MKHRTFIGGLVCSVLLILLFYIPAYADEASQTIEAVSEAEIVTASTPAITPADDFVKIGEQQQYTCTGTSSTVTWFMRDTNIARFSH